MDTNQVPFWKIFLLSIIFYIFISNVVSSIIEAYQNEFDDKNKTKKLKGSGFDMDDRGDDGLTRQNDSPRT